MTLWDMLNSTVSFLSPIFSYKTDYSSTLLSESSLTLLTTTYYKAQYLSDVASSIFSAAITSVFYSMSSTTFNALTIALKFLLLIALLIFIRGGIPRYRFDHLTKVGWIKYLSLVLASMLIQFLLLWMC